MNTLELFNGEDAYFGDALISTPHFLELLQRHGTAFPTSLQLDRYQFLQVRALLFAIGLNVLPDLPAERLHAMALREPGVSANLYMPAARLVIGAKVERQWRTALMGWVTSGALQLLDYASKLPIPAPAVIAKARQPSPDDAPSPRESITGHEWMHKARAMAKAVYQNNLARGWGSDKKTVSENVAKTMNELGCTTKTGKAIQADYVRRHVLKDWNATFGAPEKRQAR